MSFESSTESALLMRRLYTGPITRVEALEIPKLIDEVRADLRDPKIGMLDPQIELYGYETMAQLERALPAHLDDLASTQRGGQVGIVVPLDWAFRMACCSGMPSVADGVPRRMYAQYVVLWC